MFVRFRQTKTRLQASLVRSFRQGGKLCHEHIAMLGTVDVPASVPERLAFWQGLHERMARLGNRIDAATQAKLLGAVHARIPMVVPEEQRALQLANAKADAAFWVTLADMNAGTVAGHDGLIAGAERPKAAAAAEQSKAAERAAHAKDRIARIERGEDVAEGLGKPATFEDILAQAGMTKADATHCLQVAEVSDAFGFDAMVDTILKAKDCAERRTLSALHRRIKDGTARPEADGARPQKTGGQIAAGQ
jgi:hypothetical protein